MEVPLYFVSRFPLRFPRRPISEPFFSPVSFLVRMIDPPFEFSSTSSAVYFFRQKDFLVNLLFKLLMGPRPPLSS